MQQRRESVQKGTFAALNSYSDHYQTIIKPFRLSYATICLHRTETMNLLKNIVSEKVLAGIEDGQSYFRGSIRHCIFWKSGIMILNVLLDTIYFYFNFPPLRKQNLNQYGLWSISRFYLFLCNEPSFLLFSFPHLLQFKKKFFLVAVAHR